MPSPEPPVATGALLSLDLPEHGQLDLPLAGVGGRALAALIDIGLLLLVGFLLVIAVSLAVADRVLAAEIGLPVIFFVVVMLPLVGPLYFELRGRGQTPGKRMLGLRVISADGSAPSAGQLLLRNVLRLIDFLPFGYLLGLTAMFISSRGQRLGDLVGGTLVIREDPRALEEVSGYGGREAPAVPAELHGVPEAVLHGARLLLDPSRRLEPSVRRARVADLARLVRQHRPDLAAEEDDQIWARIRAAVETAG